MHPKTSRSEQEELSSLLQVPLVVRFAFPLPLAPPFLPSLPSLCVSSLTSCSLLAFLFCLRRRPVPLTEDRTSSALDWLSTTGARSRESTPPPRRFRLSRLRSVRFSSFPSPLTNPAFSLEMKGCSEPGLRSGLTDRPQPPPLPAFRRAPRPELDGHHQRDARVARRLVRIKRLNLDQMKSLCLPTGRFKRILMTNGPLSSLSPPLSRRRSFAASCHRIFLVVKRHIRELWKECSLGWLRN